MPETREEKLARTRGRKKREFLHRRMVGRKAAKRVAQKARKKKLERTESYMPNPWIEHSTPISYMPTLTKVTPARKRRGRGGGTELKRTPQRALRLLMKRYKKPGNIPTLEI